ncbi:MAG TPA: hypothetical protein VIH69_04470 [Dehalococcoidia bacterium]
MKKWFIIVSIVAVLLAASTGVGFGMLSKTKAELADTKAELTSTETELASTEAELASTEAELAEIEEVYPPGYFSSATELQNWLATDDISDRSSADAVLWYANAQELQERALEDGYIINAYIWDNLDGTYSVYCDAVTEDNSLYWWDPETDNIYYALDVKHF